jgi:hypothetical protein
MKSLIKLFFILFITELSAQTERNYIVNSDVNYNYTYMDKAENFEFGGTTILSDRKINDLKLSLAFGKKIKPNLYYGLGVMLVFRDEVENPDVDKPIYNSETGFYFSSYNSTSKSNVYSPLAFLQYNITLNERSQIRISLISQYDFERYTYERIVYDSGMFPVDDFFTTHTTSYESNRQYLKIGIVPGFSISLYKNFGMDLTLGSVGYRIKMFESRLTDIKKSREFNIGFKPENWSVGFHLTF